MGLNKDVLNFFQKHLGYSDEETAIFEQRTANAVILEKAPELMSKTIVCEVVKSHGCNSRHKVGDKIVFDGAGNLISKKNPDRVCIFALQSLAGLIFGAQELIYAGVDPNKMCFNRTGCFDVGVGCGGWGNVVMEIKVVDKKEFDAS